MSRTTCESVGEVVALGGVANCSQTFFVHNLKKQTIMNELLAIDPNVVLKSYKTLGDYEAFSLVWLAAAYYQKYRGRLPKNFNDERHHLAYTYFNNYVKPVLDGKPVSDSTITTEEQADLISLVNTSGLFDDVEKATIVDMLQMWWGRGKFSRTEMIYTQAMAEKRTGIDSEKFSEIRKFLKAEKCLNWENRPHGDYVTSFHTFNEANLYKLLKEFNKDTSNVETGHQGPQ